MLPSHTRGKVHAGFHGTQTFTSWLCHSTSHHDTSQPQPGTALDLEPLNQENQFLQYLAISFRTLGHT